MKSKIKLTLCGSFGIVHLCLSFQLCIAMRLLLYCITSIIIIFILKWFDGIGEDERRWRLQYDGIEIIELNYILGMVGYVIFLLCNMDGFHDFCTLEAREKKIKIISKPSPAHSNRKFSLQGTQISRCVYNVILWGLLNSLYILDFYMRFGHIGCYK